MNNQNLNIDKILEDMNRRLNSDEWSVFNGDELRKKYGIK